MAALYHATLPISTTIIRRSFGVAGGALSDPGNGLNHHVAWYVLECHLRKAHLFGIEEIIDPRTRPMACEVSKEGTPSIPKMEPSTHPFADGGFNRPAVVATARKQRAEQSAGQSACKRRAKALGEIKGKARDRTLEPLRPPSPEQ